MKRLIIALVAFVVVVIGFQQGSGYLSRKAEEKRGSPVVITGSYSGEESPKTDDARFRTVEWEELMPPGWNPVKSTEGLKIEDLDDNDPRAVEALKKTMEAWKNAPVNPAMNEVTVRIGGFVVPLEHQGSALKEFLLVPYYGACIHTPPPPPNQIIHVTLQKPARNIRSMDAVWVTGEMKVEKKASSQGTAGYAMQGLGITPYVEEKKETNKEEGGS
ncbi:DUF3299 domain-containing protein [Oxalobacter sp. OttesenSCG-928-P03]|nr:DUF3299 domain-containing protein [Oxalobacter sp. OttesenSCG-928-P03]